MEQKNYGIREVKDTRGSIAFEYTMDKNSALAKDLKGCLMLVTGYRKNEMSF
jgi:hypothetical protein